MDSAVVPTPTPTKPFLPDVSPLAPSPVKPALVAPPVPAPAPPAPAPPAPPAPAPVPEKPAPSPFTEPAPEEPAPDLFGEPMAPEEPAVEPEAADAPMTEAADAPDATGDLFGDHAPTVPTDPIEPVPMEDAPVDPAPAVDDLFGDPSPEPMADPAADTAPAPKNDLDDLFGTEPATPEPVNNSDLNDLFNSNEPAVPNSDLDGSMEPAASGRAVSTDIGASDSAVSADNSDIDALFGTPNDSESFEQSQANSEENDLFDAPATTDNAVEENTKPSNESNFDDLFKTTSDRPATPESFRGAEVRTWNDNTGDFSVNARLSVIFPDRIRLLKDNGKFSTVPLNRLSNADRQYVGWVAVSLQKTAGTKLVDTQTNPGNPSAELTR